MAQLQSQHKAESASLSKQAEDALLQAEKASLDASEARNEANHAQEELEVTKTKLRADMKVVSSALYKLYITCWIYKENRVLYEL